MRPESPDWQARANRYNMNYTYDRTHVPAARSAPPLWFPSKEQTKTAVSGDDGYTKELVVQMSRLQQQVQLLLSENKELRQQVDAISSTLTKPHTEHNVSEVGYTEQSSPRPRVAATDVRRSLAPLPNKTERTKAESLSKGYVRMRAETSSRRERVSTENAQSYDVLVRASNPDEINALDALFVKHGIKDKFKSRRGDIHTIFLGAYSSPKVADRRREQIEKATGISPQVVRRTKNL